MLAANQRKAAPANINRLFIELEFEGQRKRAADVRHVVIENALVRLAPGERRGRARRNIFVEAIVRGQRKHLAHIGAIDRPIIAHKNPADRTHGKGASEAGSIADVEIEFVTLRRGWARAEAHIGVPAYRELLRAPDPERQLRAEEDRMVIKKIVEAVAEREPVVIVLGAQDQVVRFRQNRRQSRANIKAAEIERAEFIIVKFLALHAE